MLMKKSRNGFLKFAISGLFLLTVLNIFSVHAYAEDQNNYESWLQTVYSRKEGLPPGEANDIATTKDGIIWVGTYAGLYRYNGSEFQLVKSDSVKNVTCLYVDDKDRLWVGTNDSGVSVFEDGKEIGVVGPAQGLPSDSIRSIVKSADGEYYVGTSDGMAVLQLKEKPEVVQLIPEIQYADKSTADQKGNVVVISSYGTMFLVKDREILTKIAHDETDRFTSCVFDDSGDIHVGTTSEHVLVYKLEGNNFRELAEYQCSGIGKVNNLIRVSESTIFVCADGGIGYFDGKNKFHNLKTQNFTSSIYNVILDYQGNLWFASARMGLLRLCKTNFIELFTEYSLPAVVVNSIQRDQDELYIGTDKGLIILNEKKHEKVENELTRAFHDIRVRQVYRDREGHLWFCTYGNGLAEYDGTTLHYHNDGNQIGSRVRTMIELRTGELVVSSENGISFIKDGKLVRTYTEKDGLKNQINLCLLEQEDGSVLAGSDGGGITQIKDQKVKQIGSKQEIASGVILRMVEDKEGDGIFVVTSNAICYLHKDGKIETLDHFPYTNNYDLFQENGSVFVMGSAGIYAVLHDELLANKAGMKYIFLDNRSGLADALVANSWTLLENGKSYLATSSGVTVFDLNAYDERPSDFQVQVASINVDGKETSIEDSKNFEFSRTVHRLEIKPEIINYSTVDPMISCYLEGFDKEPIVMSQSELSTIVYTNLPAGQYKFHVALVDPESGVSVSKKVYYLERETAFTDTKWFYILMIAGVLLLTSWIGIFVSRRMYTIRMNAKEAELARSWKISMTDALTGLGNRLAMRGAFAGYVGKPITVIMLDIDYFKSFNDTYGHRMGDVILKIVGEKIREFYSEPNAGYRFGGDEFMLCDMSESEEAAQERLQKLISSIHQVKITDCKEDVQVSFGSAFGIPQSEEEIRNLRDLADHRLYEVKKERVKTESEDNDNKG